jgi:hypothetical protein
MGDREGETGSSAQADRPLNIAPNTLPQVFARMGLGPHSPDLPRTNNDLEHAFGSHRYHERRASGRRRAAPGLVVMGSARLISALATRLRPEEGLRLRAGYVAQWQELRAELEQRRVSRRKQRRFRRNPAAYLTQLEQRCLQLTLPP